ncbi:unnamed protein product [Clonostachys rosea]|uniref:Uncharacterized protein n=1 Tax=Bionectria ochroleuca TaxID=29856 RepID=A0ABY6TRP7_BIOOC|nr:unnamed protein product [Clonostachys rosea]
MSYMTGNLQSPRQSKFKEDFSPEELIVADEDGLYPLNGLIAGPPFLHRQAAAGEGRREASERLLLRIAPQEILIVDYELGQQEQRAEPACVADVSRTAPKPSKSPWVFILS